MIWLCARPSGGVLRARNVAVELGCKVSRGPTGMPRRGDPTGLPRRSDPTSMPHMQKGQHRLATQKGPHRHATLNALTLCRVSRDIIAWRRPTADTDGPRTFMLHYSQEGAMFVKGVL